MSSWTVELVTYNFGYTGNMMTSVTGGEAFSLDYDENGNLIYSSRESPATTYEYNWDNKLRSAVKGTTSIGLKYDPLGNRIFKSSTVDSVTTDRKYIVDVVGELPVILMELEPQGGDFIVKKAYIYGSSQVLAQYNGDWRGGAKEYFYLHDRLGSVRKIIDRYADVMAWYTYNPFGELVATGSTGATENNFMFTGQWYDDEIGQYYLRARMYDPHLGRFTFRDPILGQFAEPLTLHKYLYCGNNPLNRIDPQGLWGVDRWEGHIQLTYLSMGALGFGEDDIGLATLGNIMTDFRKDHYSAFWAMRDTSHPGNIPHYSPGLESQGEAHALGALELALWYEKQGIHDVAMMFLGTGLHTMQDRWAHAEQGAGWGAHFPSGPDPDNPYKHLAQYKAAYLESKCYLEMFQEAVRNGTYRLRGSGAIGDGFIHSDIKWDDFMKNLDKLDSQGIILGW